jgi:hypothetical protein
MKNREERWYFWGETNQLNSLIFGGGGWDERVALVR